MESTTHIVAFVAGFAVLGGFIDFLLGKKGQSRLRSRLETLWVKTSYVTFRTLGTSEAQAAADTMNRIFGRSFFSKRRLIVLLIAAILAFILGFIVPAIFVTMSGWPVYFGDANQIWYFAAAIALFSVSISLTHTLVTASTRLMSSKWTSVNFTAMLVAVSLAYAATCIWGPLVHRTLFMAPFLQRSIEFYAAGDLESKAKAAKLWNAVFVRDFHRIVSWESLKPSVLVDGIEEVAWERMPEANTKLFGLKSGTVGISLAGPSKSLGYFAGVFRLGFFVIFVLSWITLFFRDFLLLIWARIVESDKPVFTMLFGGFGAFLKIIEHVLKAVT